MSIQETPSIQFSEYANLLFQDTQSGWQGIAKKLLDKTAAMAGLIVLSPILIGAAIAIKADSKGPVFFKQPRHGKNNTVFEIWKFRTMTVMERGDDFTQATKHDARITRIGRFLRKSSLDELPQLVNVLKGEMSLVGPRPHPVALNEQFASSIHGYWNRHATVPGLTGLAQIRGFRGPTDTLEKMQNRVDSDIEYAIKWSFFNDIKILAATPLAVLSGQNAH